MRSFLKPWSMRAKYCVPLRICVAPNEPCVDHGQVAGHAVQPCAGTAGSAEDVRRRLLDGDRRRLPRADRWSGCGFRQCWGNLFAQAG